MFPDVDKAMPGALRRPELPVKLLHAAEVAILPDHHCDPFDRMLVAQARADHLTVVSRDRAREAYAVSLHW